MTNIPQVRAFGQEIEENFNLTQLFQSYVNKPEITALTPAFLVAGSQNVLIDYAQRVISRNGYTLYNQANTGAGGIKSSFDWQSSNGFNTNLRAWDHTLEFDWNGTYNTLLSNLRSTMISFDKVLDYAEQQDVLLFVNGDGAAMNRWSGGASKVRTSTATTITKAGVLSSVTTIAFNASAAPGTVAATITDSANNFLAAQFTAGDTLSVTGSVGNSSNFTIASVTAGTITLIMSDVLVTEAAGQTITMYNQTGPTWKSSRFFSTISGRAFTYKGISYLYSAGENTDTLTGVTAAAGQLVGVVTISQANPAIVTRVAHGLNVGDEIFFTTTGTLPAGLTADTPYFVIAGGYDANDFEVAATAGGAAIITTDAGSGTHTCYKVTPFPTVTAGDVVWQTPDLITLPSDITTPFPLFYPDLIGVQLNMVSFASTKSQMTFGSKDIDYTNFVITSPRAPGDPYQKPLTNGNATCVVPIDNDKAILNVQNTLLFGSGLDAWDQIDFHMSADNSEELLRIIRYKTAAGSGIISKDAITSIKNAVVYISREPALDFLGQGNLEAPDGRKNVPISDSIKTDFDSYDFTNADVAYWKRAIYIALPAEGLVLIYDMMRNLWQPPQTLAISKFAIIGDQLYGHSSVTNETYQLFVGTDDNGVAIEQVARFAYNNGGTRQRVKRMTEYWTDGYITANGVLTYTINFGFNGALGSASLEIDGNDESVVVTGGGEPLGNLPLGEGPFGGDSIDPLAGLPGADTPLQRFFQIDTCTAVDYTEHYVEYRMSTLGGQFAIVAHGSNQFDAGTVPILNKK